MYFSNLIQCRITSTLALCIIKTHSFTGGYDGNFGSTSYVFENENKKISLIRSSSSFLQKINANYGAYDTHVCGVYEVEERLWANCIII